MHDYDEELRDSYMYTRILRVYYIENAIHLQIILKYSRQILLSIIISIISARIRIIGMARRIAKSSPSRTKVICPLKDTEKNFTQQCAHSSGP